MSWMQGMKVLVPIDFSEFSTSAVDQAIKLAETTNDIYVLNVVEPVSPSDFGWIYNSYLDIEHAKKSLPSLKKKFSGNSYKGLTFDTTMGDPAHAIADYASEKKMGVIVIPSHGHTGVQRLFIGSVAERVVRFAHCPVLVLRD